MVTTTVEEKERRRERGF